MEQPLQLDPRPLCKKDCNSIDGNRHMQTMNVHRAIGRFYEQKEACLNAVWLKHVPVKILPRGSLETVVAAAMAFV